MTVANGPILVCDVCGKRVMVDVSDVGEVDLPEGWSSVHIEGWVGAFHGCSAQHAAMIRAATDLEDDSR